MLVVLMALAGVASGSAGPKASAGASVKKQIKGFEKSIKKLKGQVILLQGQVVQLSKQPGRPGAQGAPGAQGTLGTPGAPGAQGTQGSQGNQGLQGPQGAAPACQGNASGDVMVAAGSVCIDRYEVSGGFGGGASAGPFAVDGFFLPSDSLADFGIVGFRGAR